MLVIGLTGGIGSGKSTVAKLFAQLGVTIVDTDQLAHDLTQAGQPALKKIINRFGEKILNPEGNLNRAYLRQLIFSDKKSRQWLEQLLHPLIRHAAQQQVESATSSYCIVVIPLLLETAPNPLINRILVIDAPETQQIKRAQQRDHSTEKDIQNILKAQFTRSQRLSAADDIIYNDKSISHLANQVEKLHRFYLQLAQAVNF